MRLLVPMALLIAILAAISGFCDGSKITKKAEELSVAPKKLKAASDPIEGIWSFRTQSGPHLTEGTVSVWRKGDIYVVNWSGISGNDEEFGTVLVSGYGLLQDDVFSITWQTGKLSGLSVFKVGDKIMRGRWFGVGSANVREETWTWVAQHKKEA